MIKNHLTPLSLNVPISTGYLYQTTNHAIFIDNNFWFKSFTIQEPGVADILTFLFYS
jgi:hypothetical protein